MEETPLVHFDESVGGSVSSSDEKKHHVSYFNNASQARFDKTVQDVGKAWITDQFQDTGTLQRDVRTSFARLIDTEASNIAIMPSTAFAITLAAKNLESTLAENGEILVLQDQFCSAVYPWQDICDRSNGKLSLRIIPYPDESSSLTERILQSLSTDLIVVACLPPLHWSDGNLIDLNAISESCRERNIPLVVDATQAVGAMEVAIPDIRPVLLACSSHKWLRGPSGTCLVYVDPAYHNLWAPLDQHGRGRDLGDKNWDSGKNQMDDHGYPETFYKDARKFDSGGKPNSILLPMLKASLSNVLTHDPALLQAMLHELMQPLFDWVENSDTFELSNNHAYHLFGIRPSKDSMTTEQLLKLCDRLLEQDIVVAVRCGALRVSPYLDNSKEDVEKLIKALQEVSA